MIWIRSRLDGQAGFVSVGVLVTTLAAAAAFMFGQSTTAHLLRLLPGGAWLLNQATGTVSHINGATGAKDGEWALKLESGQTAQKLLQVDGSVIAIDSDGNAHIIDAAKGSNQQTSQPFGKDYELFVGNSVVYSIQRSTGDVQARSGVSGGLSIIGQPINVDGPIDSGAVNNVDGLLTTVPEDGNVATVNRDAWSADREFTPNTPAGAVQVTVVRGNGVLVDTVTGVARMLEGPAGEVRFQPADNAAAAAISVDGCQTCNTAVVGVGGAVIALDFASGKAKQIDLPTGVSVKDVVVRGDDIFVQDESNAAYRVAITSGAVEAVAMPDGVGVTDITVIADNVYLNNGAGAQAVAVDVNNVRRPVEKYTPASTALAQQQANDPKADTSVEPPPTPLTETPTAPAVADPVVAPLPVQADVGGSTQTVPPAAAVTAPEPAAATPATAGNTPATVKSAGAPTSVSLSSPDYQSVQASVAVDPNTTTVIVSLSGGSSDSQELATGGANSVTASFSVMCGSAYSVAAIAIGADGVQSAPTGGSAPVTPTCPQGPPSNLSVSSGGESSLTASWDAPQNGVEPTSYQVDWSSGRSRSISATFDTASGLSAATTYSVTVTAYMGDVSMGSASASGTTDSPPPPPPPPPPSSWSGTVQAGSAGCINVRSSPTPGASSAGCLSTGAGVTVQCYVYGASYQYDASPASSIWYRVGGGYVVGTGVAISGFHEDTLPPSNPVAAC